MRNIKFHVTIAAFVFPCAASAQANRISAADITARFASQHGVDFAHAESETRAVLEGAQYSKARKDSVAFALESMAIHAGRDLIGPLAITALAYSSRASLSTPYEGAFDHLVRIYEQATDVGTRGGALVGIAQIADRKRALPFLKEIATRNDMVFVVQAETVIDAIALYGGDEGREVLRTLHAQHLVTEPNGRRRLDFLAGNGFRFPARP